MESITPEFAGIQASTLESITLPTNSFLEQLIEYKIDPISKQHEDFSNHERIKTLEKKLAQKDKEIQKLKKLYKRQLEIITDFRKDTHQTIELHSNRLSDHDVEIKSLRDSLDDPSSFFYS